jgi:hypothetical protein
LDFEESPLLEDLEAEFFSTESVLMRVSKETREIIHSEVNEAQFLESSTPTMSNGWFQILERSMKYTNIFHM